MIWPLDWRERSVDDAACSGNFEDAFFFCVRHGGCGLSGRCGWAIRWKAVYPGHVNDGFRFHGVMNGEAHVRVVVRWGCLDIGDNDLDTIRHVTG